MKPGNKTFGVFIGVIAAATFIFAIGHTSALAAPPMFFQAFGFTENHQPAIFMWQLGVVYGLAVGLPATLVSWYLQKKLPRDALQICSSACMTAWLLIMFAPLIWASTFYNPFDRPWWTYSLEIMLLAGFLLIPLNRARALRR